MHLCFWILVAFWCFAIPIPTKARYPPYSHTYTDNPEPWAYGDIQPQPSSPYFDGSGSGSEAAKPPKYREWGRAGYGGYGFYESEPSFSYFGLPVEGRRLDSERPQTASLQTLDEGPRFQSGSAVTPHPTCPPGYVYHRYHGRCLRRIRTRRLRLRD
jgi:hypothetical protein